MSEATIIDGKAAAAEVRAEVAREVAELTARGWPQPGLAVVLVGDDPASEIYVRNKGKATRAAGLTSFEHRLPAGASQAEVAEIVAILNADDAVDGILVQLPLPPQVDAGAIINAIDPAKDVDGLHVVNAGRLVSGQMGLVPCTPAGCMILLKQYGGDLTGKRALVIGRSNLVGRPIASLLLAENCTVTMAHSRTKDLSLESRYSDIVVAATGQPEMVRGDWIKPGATIIDVGINRIEKAGKRKLVGDVAFDEARAVAGAVAPVPGGVGPMTIACLLRNTLAAAKRRRPPN
jgi:methylenetetrahydrofolate dehydrogenase (NADP+)/methenyltetrahydrofolate cyclohydrolase